MNTQPAVSQLSTTLLPGLFPDAQGERSLINALTSLNREDPSFHAGIHTLTFKRGEVVATPDNLNENMYILVNGEVNLVCVNESNRRLVASVLQPGAVFGEGAPDSAIHTNNFAEARNDVTLWKIKSSDVRNMTLQYPILSWALLQTYSERLAQVEDNLEDVAYKTLPERLAQLLLDYTNFEEGTIKGVSHQVLADHLGTYRETVSAILRDFKQQHLVDLGYRRIEILDAEALSDLAGIWEW